MKRIALAIAGAVAAFIAAVLVLPAIGFFWGFIWMDWNRPSCNEDSPAVAYARSLPEEHLARLYRDMESYSARADSLLGWSVSDTAAAVPKEFADLKVVRIRPHQGNIMVHGCFDHYVYLTFEGVGVEKGFAKERRIILNWGEYPPQAGEQVLWTDVSRLSPEDAQQSVAAERRENAAPAER